MTDEEEAAWWREMQQIVADGFRDQIDLDERAMELALLELGPRYQPFFSVEVSWIRPEHIQLLRII